MQMKRSDDDSPLPFFFVSRTIEAMRYLGIDYGVKRIGVAVSDDDGAIAFPGGVLENKGTPAAIRAIIALAKKEKASAIVIGLPIAMSQEDTEQTRITRDFIAKLEKKITVPVMAASEVLTTHSARESATRSGHHDASAAALILQGYLDACKN